MAHRRRPEQIKIVDMSIRQCSKERMKQKEEQYQNVTWQEIDEHYTSLDGAATLLNYKRVNYVRQLTLSGKLEGVKLEMRGFEKWFVELVAIDWYKNHKARRSSIRRYILHLNPDDEEHVRSLLDNAEEAEDISGYELELAYKGKD